MDWSSYSSCSATCGGGQKQRSRVCSGGHGKCGSGRSTERVTCNEEECPSLTAWTQWSECSVTCGYGSRTRSRSCLSPDGTPAKCYAALNSEQGCYRRDCRKMAPIQSTLIHLFSSRSSSAYTSANDQSPNASTDDEETGNDDSPKYDDILLYHA